MWNPTAAALTVQRPFWLCWAIWNALRFALRIISGKIFLNFGVQKRLRAFLNPIFTDGVVTENGICNAAFYESAALRLASSPSQSPLVTTLPKGEPLA